MAISVGDKLPNATLTIMTDDGPTPCELSTLTAGKKIIIFGVPGAFTPTCHGNHLPGFLDNLDAFKAKGIDDIAVVSVNDVFVMDQWATTTGGAGKIHYLSDGAFTYTKSIGMDIDLSDFGMGVRSKRYSMVVEDGTVTMLNVEDVPKSAEKSGAATMLEAL
ncbi:MAG: peroxiredoxin [Hyphomicrobiales bacterium]